MGGETQEKRGTCVREVGREGAVRGMLKVVGSGRNVQKLCNIAQYLAIEKGQRGGT